MGSMKDMELEEKELDKILKEGKVGLSIEGVNTEDKAHTPEDNTQANNTPKQPVPEVDEWKKKYEAMEHKYNVLKGKEYSEVPRLQAENKDLRSKIDQLERSINEVKQEKAKQLNEANNAEMDKVFDTLTNELGATAVDSIKRIMSSSHSDREIESLKKQLADNENKIVQLEQKAVKVQKNSFVEKLNTLVPDWESINKDNAWLCWLEGRLPGSRSTYQEALDVASRDGDIDVVVEIFNTFKNTKTSKPKNSKVNTEDLLEPGQARQQAPEGDRQEKIYTQREINNIYKQIQRGVYSDKKARELEADIDLAYQEGRIRES